MATAEREQDREPLDEWTKPPFLRRVRIRGFKSIAACDVPLQPLTILVGRNGSGKSNFLGALAFLKDVITEGLVTAEEKHGPWSSLVCRTADAQTIEFEIETGFICGRPYHTLGGDTSSGPSQVSTDKATDLEGRSLIAEYRLLFSADRQSIPFISAESLVIKDLSGEPYRGFNTRLGRDARRVDWFGTAPQHESEQVKKNLSVVRKDSTLLGVLGFKPFIDLADQLRWMGFYNFHPEAMRGLQAPRPGKLLKEDGANLGSVLGGMSETDPEVVRRVQDYLAVIAPEIQGFAPARYGARETVRFRLHSPSPSVCLEFDAASMSDGTLRVLGALVAAFQNVPPYGHPSVIGIEEPETSLHPAAAHALVSALDGATEHTQILLTTHSGDLLADPKISPSSVLVVRLRNGRTEIAPVDAAGREIIRRELYTLADLQRMGLLNPDEEDLERQAAAPPVQEG